MNETMSEDDLAETKKRIRSERLAVRDALSVEERVAGSDALVAHACELGVARGSVVSGFLPIRSEIDVRPLLSTLVVKYGITVGLPIILKSGGLFFRAYEDGDDLIPLGFGTYGPSEDRPVVVPDLILAPLAAFDWRGERIGYGKGHYDQTIARLRREGFDPRVVGVAYACQEVERVPAEPHDVPLEMILTEKGLIRTTPDPAKLSPASGGANARRPA